MKRYQMELLLSAIKNLRLSASDEIALTSIYAYPEWKVDTGYTVGDRIRYGELLYRCIQSHTSLDVWPPDVTPALWARVSVEEWPEWVQPLGAEDAYHIGDKVTHNGSHWISEVDVNTWEPGVYGWSAANG